MAQLSSPITAEASSITAEQLSIPQQLDALRTGAGVAAIRAGWIAVTGEDRVRWLNGMVTNSVQALAPGEGAYSFLLSVQGRIQGDAVVWAKSDLLLMQTSPEQTEGMLALLDRFIIMDDVELSDESARWQGIVVAGPLAAEKLTAVGIPARASRLLKKSTAKFGEAEFSLISAYSPLVPRFEVWSRDAAALAALRDALVEQGAAACGDEAMELLRILEGTPKFGTDIRERELPQETGQTRALHFNKGCYLGQEIVERIRSRGSVHRTFAAFTLQGDVPAAGAVIEADGKAVGELTTIAQEPIDGERVALGFIRREALERGLILTYPGGEAAARTSGEATPRGIAVETAPAAS